MRKMTDCLGQFIRVNPHTEVGGIDPAIRSKGCGMARLIRSGGELKLFPACDFEEVLRYVTTLNSTIACGQDGTELIVLCEAPKTKKGWGLKVRGGWTAAINCGMGLGAMLIMARLLESCGCAVVRVHPKDTGLSAGEFREITGYTGRSNQDSRNAGMMIWNYCKEHCSE
jgi:hypothetical protein